MWYVLYSVDGVVLCGMYYIVWMELYCVVCAI